MKKLIAIILLAYFNVNVIFAQGTPTMQFKTVADMVAFPIPTVANRLTAFVSGRKTANDGNGGTFIYESSSSFSTNDAYSAFKPAASNGRWLRVPVIGGFNPGWSGLQSLPLAAFAPTTTFAPSGTNIGSSSGRGPLLAAAYDAGDGNPVNIFGYNQFPSFSSYLKTEPSIAYVVEGKYAGPSGANDWMESYTQYVPTNSGSHYSRSTMTVWDRTTGLPLTTYFGAGGNGYYWGINDGTGTDGKYPQSTIGKPVMFLDEQKLELVNVSADISPAASHGKIVFWTGDDEANNNGLEAYIATAGGGGFGVLQTYFVEPVSGEVQTRWRFRRNSTNWGPQMFQVSDSGLVTVPQNLTVGGAVIDPLVVVGTNHTSTSGNSSLHLIVTDDHGVSVGPSIGFYGPTSNFGTDTNKEMAFIAARRLTDASITPGDYRSRLDFDAMNTFGTMQHGLSVVGGLSGEALARVGVGTTNPAASALFEVASTVTGSLPAPRMTTAQRDAIVAPAAGLMVTVTDGNPGLYEYRNTAWHRMAQDDSPTFSGTVTHSGRSFQSYTNLSGTTINCSLADGFLRTATAGETYTFSNTPDAGHFQVVWLRIFNNSGGPAITPTFTGANFTAALSSIAVNKTGLYRFSCWGDGVILGEQMTSF